MDVTMTKPAPVAPIERIQSLDLLRGFAILGILIMNIQSYSMPSAAYMNPTAYGDLTGLNKLVWMLSHLLADTKFMTIFTILFGAGIVLFTDRVESKGLRPAGLHYRRTLWLLAIGLLHAYLLWHGDILVTYAVTALFAYFFRKKSPKTLLIAGFLFFLVPSLLYLFFGWSTQFWPEQAIQGQMMWWRPDQAAINKEIAAMTGGIFEQMQFRIPQAIMMQTFVYVIFVGWRTLSVMLLGMALYKTGVLSAQRSNRFYVILLLCGFALGYPIIYLGVLRNFAADWTLTYSMYIGSQFNYWGSLFVACGYISLLMLFSKSKLLAALQKSLAAVGRTAFTNYLSQTIICTFIFYGQGLALFGRIPRKDQILFVFGIWILQLIVSPLWLRYFRFGPAEWIWRSLTYKQAQPFLVKKDAQN